MFALCAYISSYLSDKTSTLLLLLIRQVHLETLDVFPRDSQPKHEGQTKMGNIEVALFAFMNRELRYPQLKGYLFPSY